MASSSTAAGSPPAATARIGCSAMPADLGTLLLAQSETHSPWITAAVAVGVSILVAFIVHRAFEQRARLTRGVHSPVLDTRLRFVRRVLIAAIIIVGLFLALNQFASLSRLATSLLASGAIAAAILGFAARQTLANFVAGVMLAVTQPLRIGDWVSFEDAYGIVEDVRLNYTVLRTPSEQRIVIPNERLAGGIMRNDTLVVAAVSLDVSVWIAPGADADRAVRVLAEETSGGASVAEATPDGIRISVTGERVTPAEKGAREADLRARCLQRLHTEGLLPGM
jgi:small-conductance mechanosensitive channel